MGTVVSIDVHLSRDRDGAGLVDAACEILQHADRVFSTWNSNSPMSRLRRGEITLAEAPPEMGEVLGLCVVARRHSWGWFDPWAMPGGIDLTGYVKGWAAQRALESLRQPGVEGAIVNAAGDVAFFGSPGKGQPFRIGIVDPFDRHLLACVVEPPGAVATSGDYERGPHLIDPRTGEALARLASATVSGPDLGLADALATGLAVGGMAALPALAALEGYEALAIERDGRWRWTPGFPFADQGGGPQPPEPHSPGPDDVAGPPDAGPGGR